MDTNDESDAYKPRAKMFIRLAIARGWRVSSVSEFGIALQRGKRGRWSKELCAYTLMTFGVISLLEGCIRSGDRTFLTPVMGMIAILLVSGMVWTWFFEEEIRFLFRSDILDDAKSIDEMLK